MDFELFGTNMRTFFRCIPSTSAWRFGWGFWHCSGVATDDGVLVATFIRDRFKENQPQIGGGHPAAIVEGGLRGGFALRP